MEHITNGISHIAPGDLDELVRLHEEYLNYGDGIRPHFERILSDPDNVALKYMCNGEMAGIDIYTKGIALSGGHEDMIKQIEKMSDKKSVYTADAVLVKREYRSLGVAGKLRAGSMKELRRRNAELILYELWVHPDGHIPAYKMLRGIEQITVLGRFENFYRDFHHYGYICPICGKECMCAAEIYLAGVPEVEL